MRQCKNCKSKISKKGILCRKCAGVKRRNNPYIATSEYRRNWQLKKKYGLKVGEFEAFWVVCRGRCFICDKTMKMPTKTRGQGLDTAAVDHDHTTGKVRGLLCSACNKALGLFKDDKNIIKKALKYISNE